MPKRRKMFYRQGIIGRESKRVRGIETVLEKLQESNLPKKPVTGQFPVPQTLEQVPDKMFHSARRILLQEKNQKINLPAPRKRFEEVWGFSLDKIAHLIKL